MKYIVTSISKNPYFVKDNTLTSGVRSTSVPIYEVRLESMEDPNIYAIFTANDAGFYYTYVEQPPIVYKGIFGITHIKYPESEKVKVPFDERLWTPEEKGKNTAYRYVLEMNKLLNKYKKEELKRFDIIGE